tara:strand:- start:7638 stop:9095 length:1458 start_codon:yes stop_codon:yes gene_type:complete
MTIGLNAFQGSNNGLSGFGVGSESDIAELSKALEAGYQVSSQTGGSALRVESLEASLKVLTYSASHIKFWKKVPKSPAYSTVEEYNQLSDYGGQNSPFLQEGELPASSDSSYVRRTQLVKFLGTTREVTHQASLVHPAHGDLIALENQNGILWLLEQVERNLFEGDSSLAFDGEAEQWDGLDALVDSTMIIDLEGNSLQEADLEEAANEVIENYGFPTDVFLGTRSMSDLVKTLYPRERIQLPAPVNGQIGSAVQTIATQAGVLEFNPDVFIRQGPTPPAAATSASAPAAVASIIGNSTATATGDHAKGAPVGAICHSYIVTACNRFGESAPMTNVAVSDLGAAQVLAGNCQRLTITNAGTIGSYPPEFFKIYRSAAMAGSSSTVSVPAAALHSLILKVPASSQTASGVTTVDDVNLTLPFTSSAYVGELTPSVMTFRQLMPLMKMDLAVLSPAYRWMVLLYGTPILFAPKKWIRLINVGTMSAR